MNIKISTETTSTQVNSDPNVAPSTDHDLLLALQRYTSLLTDHPRTNEAEDARMQVYNIATSVVPASALPEPYHQHFAKTPQYVLLEGNQRLGPSRGANLDREPTWIYGFSDKEPYELFRANSAKALRPYPLVKRYLQSETEGSGMGAKLIVLDATGPQQARLGAATMQAVLEAHQLGAPQVTVTCFLLLDAGTGDYALTLPS